MSSQYLTRMEEPPVPPYDGAEMAQGLYGALARFLALLLIELDERVDKRLVRTFLQTVAVILTFRDRVNGLLLSEMGGYLDTPDKAPAGTKRLSRLLHCVKWSAELIRQYLWKRATRRLEQWKDAGLDALAIWDESVWEKPESIAPEEYGPVRSSKGRRLTRIKKGYDTPPRGPIFVPGLHWLAVILVGRDQQHDPPELASMRWWTSRGPRESFKRGRARQTLAPVGSSVGTKGAACLRSGLCQQFLARPALCVHPALCAALEERVPVGRCSGQPASRLENRAWQAGVARADGVGLPSPPMGQSQHSRLARASPGLS